MLSKITHVFDKGSDPRSSNLLLMSPTSFFSSLGVYLLLVRIILPKYMSHRKPYNIKKILVIYNALQVVMSSYLFYLASKCWFGNSEITYWRCNSVNKTNHPTAVKEVSALHLYLLSKFVEFLDTFFFILRKKGNQVTFLHVYHHTTTPIFAWFIVRYYPGGSFIFPMMFNAFIHVVMYTYYLLAAMGPRMEKYLWWKKYITVMQLAQFVICLIHFVFAAMSSECNIPVPVITSIILNSSFLYILFANFFDKSYKRDKKGTNEAESVEMICKRPASIRNEDRQTEKFPLED